MKMKKLLVMLFICAAGAVACGKKIMPESDANNQSKPANDKAATAATQQANTNTSATSTPSFNNMKGSVLANQDNPRPVSLDKGKTVYVSKCNTCHALKNPGDYTTDQMNNILKAEIPKAKLDSKEAEQVTAYLLANTKK